MTRQIASVLQCSNDKTIQLQMQAQLWQILDKI
ncbi:hypothetical protein XM38_009970 [Halomicronema hongdechloris C2206]|uniref:Uncharacterized protein n=1 Tax=Halomicronema hongdechloris C2206 TaxID=1641165 RepID=A0A1Z3HIY1_9CYAN|nr:hypothetical protein XM38_009970 [Halomicronema hongdechloris C2206]